VRFDGSIAAAQLGSNVSDPIPALDGSLDDKLVMFGKVAAELIRPAAAMPSPLYHAAARAFEASRCEQIDLIASESFGNTRTRGWFARNAGTPSSETT
jgi:hypothetical protein